MDFATTAIRIRAEKPTWNVLPLTLGFWNASDPTPVFFSGNRNKRWINYVNDKLLEKYRQSYVSATTLEQKKAVAKKVQIRFYEIGVYAPVVQVATINAYRSNLKGVLNTALLFFWNISKNKE